MLFKSKEKIIFSSLFFFGILFSVLIIWRGTRHYSSSQEYHEASFYETLGNNMVRCRLCPNQCLLKEGQRGLCKARENIKGKLYSLVYGQPVITAIDPIEKKPLYHFLPGSKAYSLATSGCNLSCKYCQNWEISQKNPEEVITKKMSPQEVIEEALNSGSQSIAFTYNEPVVWYEYMLDIATLAHQKNLKTVMISNGFVNQEPLENLLNFLDAVKIDLKAFNEEKYFQLTGGKLEPVLNTLKTVKKKGKWLEIVYLIVPSYNDNLEEIKNMCLWIKDNLGVDVPLHFSRFWPNYRLLSLPPTPEEIIKKAREICLDTGLLYVYTGNILDEEGSTTYCPDNHQPLLKRKEFLVEENLLDQFGKANLCPSSISGIWR